MALSRPQNDGAVLNDMARSEGWAPPTAAAAVQTPVIFEERAIVATAVRFPFVVLMVRTYPETTGSWAPKDGRWA